MRQSRSRSRARHQDVADNHSIDLSAVTLIPPPSQLHGDCFDGLSLQYRHEDVGDLLSRWGVCRLTKVVPDHHVTAMRARVLQAAEATTGLPEVFIHSPARRRHLLLGLENATDMEFWRVVATKLQPLLVPVLGADATLVELAAIVVTQGAEAQPIHRDVYMPTHGSLSMRDPVNASCSGKLAKVVTAQIVLQDTDLEMGPLTVFPATHYDRVGRTKQPESLEAASALPLPSPAGTLIMFDGSIRHFGGCFCAEGIGVPSRVVVYATFMQEHGEGLRAPGGLWALSYELWGKHSLGSFPTPAAAERQSAIAEHCISKPHRLWSFDSFPRAEQEEDCDDERQLGCESCQAAGVLGDLRLLQRLLPTATQQTSRGTYLQTLLLHACRFGRKSIVQWLISEGASVDVAPCGSGHRPLHVAAEGGFADVVALLLEKMAPADAPDDMHPSGGSATPLHLAAWRGHTAVAGLLLQNSAAASSIDDAKASPLHRAVAAGHESLVSLLLNERAGLDIVDCRGRSASHIAATAGHTAIMHILSSVHRVDGMQEVELVD